MFSHLIIIQPLGLLYGSSGPFLSPENLVGRSGNSFPPSAATVSGLYANKYRQTGKEHHLDLPNLTLAGPFWAYQDDIFNFYVPTPLNYLVNLDSPNPEAKNAIRQGKIAHKLQWDGVKKTWFPGLAGKFSHNTWLPIEQWENPQTVSDVPWQYLPHLHPRLETNQRVVHQELERGSLFLENSVQMHPDTCLIYLTNSYLESGWYRFGGEGHLVEIDCKPISENTTIFRLLTEPINTNLALITPAIWGSNRFSYRFPMVKEDSNWKKPQKWEHAQIFTERPATYRYRLGGALSRGRYAVPAGTVYILENPLSESWLQWDENWFPFEGYSFKRWGCGLALPLIS